jgi:tetratricopeptide (TPR) repeat protein
MSCSAATEQLDSAAKKLDSAAEQLGRIEKTVNDIKKPHNAPTNLTRQDMPPMREIFYGRQSFVDEIAFLLANQATSRVCITGPGGMGKTSLALAVMESAVNQIFRKEYQFWVPCVEAKSADLLRRILYTQLRITADSYDSLEPLIKELDASKDRRVLLLDNFETPWLSGHDQDKVGDILSRLAKLSHISLLVTMTSAFPPSDNIEWQHRELPSLNLVAARGAFKRIYPGVNDGRKLDELLDVIDRIPLAIVLMANVGKHSRASPEYLLEQWSKTGTEMISRGPSQSMDRTISVSVNREVVASNPEAFTLLGILSMLPAGTTGSNLSWWAPTLSSHIAAIETLRTAALVEQEDGDFETSRIFVRPTVQSYMAHQDRIPEDIRRQINDTCHLYVLAHKSTPGDAKFKGDVLALESEQTNIQGLLMQIDAQTLRPYALDALVAFSLYQLRTKPSTVVALHALEVARATRDDRLVAEAHQCLGKIFLRLDHYEEACQHLEDARRWFKNSPDGPDRLRAGECSMDLAETWMYMSRNPDEIREAVLEAKDDLSYDWSDKYHVARGLVGLGMFLQWNGDFYEALETLDSAKVIFEDLDCPASITECLFYMAWMYARRQDYAKALSIAELALANAQRAGDEHRVGETLQIVAANLMCLGSHDKAFGMIAQALSTTQGVGSPLGIGQTLELLAYNCAAKMDISGARDAYEGAQVQFKNIASTLGDCNEARCADNLRKLNDMNTIDQALFSTLAKPEVLWFIEE